MSILSRIAVELVTPSAQLKDWYGWCQNQCSHAFFGAVIALFLPTMAVPVALLTALLKELADFLKIPTKDTFNDSAVDIAFWGLGAWLFSTQDYKVVAAILLSFALLCGAIPRLRQVNSKS